MFQWPEDQPLTYLDALAAAGANQLCNTMSDREDGNLRAYPEVAPGQYDPQQWNDSYWQRFKRFLEKASRRAILLQVELWDPFDHRRAHWETVLYHFLRDLAPLFPNGGDVTLRRGQNGPRTLRVLSTDRIRWLRDPCVQKGPDIGLSALPGAMALPFAETISTLVPRKE